MGTKMPRIRIDNDANELLDQITERIDGSKKGLASELIRRGAESIIDKGNEYLCPTCKDTGEVKLNLDSEEEVVKCPDCTKEGLYDVQ